ncbi:T-complex protein 11-like protein 1 isoform X2 [Dreissena polymorpha]|uniref:T-complex protein 11-like protein 1 isoform X2 n=1 Tax=Dreissena polymorpha TaxID=45954 RepID=UPI0022653C58|nr:T-complex protein 11-like protein 1 isoform X2 [Dreissena polymorpha]
MVRNSNMDDGNDKNLDDVMVEDCDDEEEDSLSHSAGSEADMHPKRQRLHLDQSPKQTPFMVQPSPPKFVTLKDLMEAAKGVQNMSLAHEIAVDTNFQLQKMEPPEHSLEKRVKEVVHKAFWDLFEEKIREDPPDYGQAVVLMNDVKESVMSVLLPQHVRIKSQMEEVLDTDLIRQKLANDAFDIYYYSEYVIGIMAKLCSPARDERIAKLRETKDVVPLFKEIFEVLDLMKMDMANFTIQQIRPYIQQQSVEYEKKKFEEFRQKQRESGIDSLELTRQWIDRSLERLSTQEDVLAGGASVVAMPTPAVILNGAYMELLEWDLSRLFPETLVLDQSRLLVLRDQTQRITMVTSVMLVTYNTVGETIQGVQQLKVKLKDEICAILEGDYEKELTSRLEGIAEQVNKNVTVFLEEHGFKPLEESHQRTLKGQIRSLANKESPVITLMSKRVISFIQTALFSKHTEPLKLPVGMSVMEKELSQLCGQFLRLISHNRAVFGQYYSDIIDELTARNKDLNSSSNE